MRVAALQFDVRREAPESNLDAAEAALRAAAADGVQLACLPELWATSFPGPRTDLAAELVRSQAAVERLAALGRELGLAVAGSGYGRVHGADFPANRFQLWLPGGSEPALSYDKVHLFSPTAEHESFTAGDEPPPTVDTPFGRVSACICYDLRFPEFTRVPFLAGAELMLVPAQWPVTRAAHFRALAAGLAVGNQCFVLACNRTGSDVVGRRELRLDFPGNSVLVSPHGEVLAEGDGQPGVVAGELDLDLVRELRKRVPVSRDRRPELYRRWRPD